MGFLFGHSGAYKKAEKNWDAWRDKAEAEYMNQAGQGIQSSAYQQALAAERDLLKRSLANTEATAAVTGATPAAQALAREQATEAIADATSKMGSQVGQDRNSAMGNYLNAARIATEGKNNALLQEAQAQSQALSGLISAGAQVASSFAKPI